MVGIRAVSGWVSSKMAAKIGGVDGVGMVDGVGGESGVGVFDGVGGKLGPVGYPGTAVNVIIREAPTLSYSPNSASTFCDANTLLGPPKINSSPIYGVVRSTPHRMLIWRPRPPDPLKYKTQNGMSPKRPAGPPPLMSPVATCRPQFPYPNLPIVNAASTLL